MKANKLSQTFITKLILTGLKLAVLIGGVAYFLSAIISTYAHVIYYEETVVPDDFADGTFIYTGLNASEDSVQLIPIGLAGRWLTQVQTVELPTLTELAAVAYADKIFVIGGFDGSETRATIYSATINTALTNTISATNTLFDWVELNTTLPVALRGAAAVIYPQTEATATLYVLGGWSTDLQCTSSYTVYYATVVSSTGEIAGGFKATASLPKALHYHSALIYGDTIYVMGGYNLSEGPGCPYYDEMSNSVYYSTIQPDGSLSTWQETSSLPPSEGRGAGAAVVFEGENAQGTISRTIYYIGGSWINPLGHLTATLNVYYADIKPDKSLLNWTESYSGFLPVPLQFHGAVLASGEIFLTGGRTGEYDPYKPSNISSTVKAALVDIDDRDRLYNWRPGEHFNRWLTGQLLPQERASHATVEDKGEIWVIGGVDKDEDERNTVYHGTVHGSATGRYAPEGSYLSNKIKLEAPAQLKKLVWEATTPKPIEQVSLTMQCRYSSTLPLPAEWQDAPVTLFGETTRVYTYTFTDAPTDTLYFQYKADFHTVYSTSTPRLHWVRLYYDVADPDVAVSKESKEAGEPKPYAWSGDHVTYTIYYTAGGSVPAQGVVITETVPENTAYVESTGWQQVGSSNTYTYFVGTIGITGTQEVAADVDFVVLVTTAIKRGIKHITDVVRIDYPPMIDTLGLTTTDPITGNNVFTYTMDWRWEAWEITKTAEPDTSIEVKPTQTITYILTYTNTGTYTAPTGVRITDTVDTTKLHSFVPSDGGVVSENIITWNITTPVPVNTPYSVTITAVVTRPLDDGEEIVNRAELRGKYPRLFESNSITHIVSSSPVLTITKSAEPPPGGEVKVNVGETILYTITYTNTGHMKAYNVVITDTVSEHLKEIEPSPPGVSAGNIITWTNLPALTVDSWQVVAFTATVKPTARDQIITNTAIIAAFKAISQTSEPITHSVLPGPILNIYKDDGYTPPAEQVDPGQTLTYTILYTNTGTMTATNLVLTDTIPLSTTYQSGGSDWTQVYSRVFTLSVPDLGVPKSGSESDVATMTVRVADDAPGMLITNTVELEGTDLDGYPAAAEEAIDVDLIPGRPDLSVQKDDGLTDVERGDTLTYTISYNNSGNLLASGIVITEIVPENTDCVGGCPGWNKVDSRTYISTVADVPIGGSAPPISITVQVKPDAPRGLITNTVEIAASGEENLTDNTDQDVDNVTVAEFIIEKTDNRTEIEPGEALTYTINYTNTGDATARNVIITETLPLSTTYVGYGWTHVEDNVYIREVPNLKPDEHMYTEIKAKVNYGEPPGPMTNTVQIGASYASTESATDVTTVSAVSKVLIYKSDGVGGVHQGDIVSYTIVYTNAGNAELNNVIITDTIPDDTIKLPGGSDWQGSNPYTITLPYPLGPGDSGTATLIVTVDPHAPLGKMTNTVEIAAIGASGIVTDFAEDVDYVFEPEAQLYDLYVVSLATDPEEPFVGQGTDFIVKVANQGGEAKPSVAEGETVIATFQLPSEVDVSDLYYIWVGLYVDPANPPQYPDDHSDYIGWVYLQDLEPDDPPVEVTWTSGEGWGTLPHVFGFAGGHTAYAQVDVWAWDDPATNRSYGMIPEIDETNNIESHEIWVKNPEHRIHLPIILKND